MAMKESLQRTMHSLLTTSLHFRWLNDAAMQALEAAVGEAERGHNGEIRLVIERAMPLGAAWHQTVRDRAEYFFAHLRVWDTRMRSGVLVYVNLAERRLELVADRGIDARVAQTQWQAMCDTAAAGIAQGKPLEALCALLTEIGEALRTALGASDDPHGDELPNAVVLR